MWMIWQLFSESLSLLERGKHENLLYDYYRLSLIESLDILQE
jgi:hypothetical protein